MITKNLPTLNIHRLTQEQYNRELLAGNIDNDALYFTTDDSDEQFEEIRALLDTKVPTSRTINNKALTGNSVVSTKNYIDGTNVQSALEDLDVALASVENTVGTKAPTSHASSSTTYGVGSASNYGHLKVGNNISVSSGTISLTKANVTAALGYTPPTTNTVYTHPTATSRTSGLYKITVDGTGHVTGATSVTKSDITGLGIPGSDTTYSAATTAAAGLMSAEDKVKLNGIATSANNYSLPSATSSVLGGVKIGSNISVSNGSISLSKANVTGALGYTPPTANTTYSAATTAAAGLMSAADKTKLDGIATSANNYSLPSATSSVLGGVKIGSNISVSNGTISLSKANVTGALGYTPPSSTYSHPTFTARSSGLYKITVNNNGHVTATAAVTASDLPSHTHASLEGGAYVVASSTQPSNANAMIWIKTS